MMPTLTEVARNVVESLGSGWGEVEFSRENSAKIMKRGSFFNTHFHKMEESRNAIRMSQGQEEASSDHSIPSGQQDARRTADAALRFTCTCLRDARDHLQVLCHVMDLYLSDLLAQHGAIANHTLESIGFQDLWLLFKPGDLVITSREPLRASRVLRVHGGRPLLTNGDGGEYRDFPSGVNKYQDPLRKPGLSPFVIDCVGIDLDGVNFGPIHEEVKIEGYDDTKSIFELEIYPIDFDGAAKDLKKSLLVRGQRFARLRSFQHKRYTRLSLTDAEEEVCSRSSPRVFDSKLTTSH